MIRLIVNNNTVKFEGNKPALQKAFKKLKFRHPNAFHIQKRVKYNWDGFVYPLSKKATCKTGLLPKVVDLLTEFEDEYEIVDYRDIPELKGVPDKVGPLTLRGYQKDAIEAFVFNTVLNQPFPRGTFLDSMNAGKTAIMCGVHASYKDAKTMILIDNSVLYKQLKKDLKEIFPDTYGYMQGSKDLKWGDIMVVMVKTLQNRLDVYKKELREFNILLTDEADLAVNKTFKNVYSKLHHITVRGGFTGTAFMRNLAKDRLKNTEMEEVFGKIIHEITMKELEDLGHSTEVLIKIVPMNKRVIPKTDFKTEYDTLITHNKDRHKKIKKRVRFNLRANRRNIIIFCKYIEQTEILYKYLSKKMPDVKMEYTHHKRSNAEILDAFRLGKIEVLITSLYLKRGMNFPLIKVVMNNAGGEGYANPLQLMARGNRKDKSKDRYYFEDFYDAGKFLERHSRRRITYYKARKVKLRDLR